MADATCADVPSVKKTWSASTLTSPPETSVRPLPANLGSVADEFQSVTISPSPIERDLQQRNAVECPTVQSTEPRSPSGNWHPISPSNSMTSKNSNSTLSVLSAAAASLKDKTQQVAQQQKRALSAFQQKGGLVSWLHGEMEDPGSNGSSIEQRPLATLDVSPFVNTSELCTPPSPCSPVETSLAGRRHSVPNLRSNSLLDNFLDKIAAVTTSTPSSPHAHATVEPRPTVASTKPSVSSSGALTSPKIGRQRAATTDLPTSPKTNTITNGSISKAQSSASLSSPLSQPETRFSLDNVLSDEWSCSVLWAHLYSSAAGRDHQHHQRLSFLIETAFRITPLFQKFAGSDGSTDKEMDFKKLVTSLKRLHSRFLVQNGVNNGVPVASPAAIQAKTQLSIAIHTLTDQRMPDSEKVDIHVEKTISALLQLAREVEREFRVLGTRSYVNFADSVLYRNFIAHRSGSGNIALVLRAARIPFYQQPNAENTVCLELLRAEQNEDPLTLFARAGCQVFTITLQPDYSVNFTDISPYTSGVVLQQVALHTIAPFLNPSTSVNPAGSKALAFNFIAGSGTNVIYGAVMWLPVEQSNMLGVNDMPSGLCIISKFPLVDSMRHFLCELWSDISTNADVNDRSAQVTKASLAMRTQFFIQPSDQLPVLDFKLDDLFDCLSLTNVLRLFAFILLEKKIVLVASSYTILFCVSKTVSIAPHLSFSDCTSPTFVAATCRDLHMTWL